MSALEMYLQQTAEAKGMLHKARLEGLRTYIKMSTEDELLTAISKITNLTYLRILVEAGLRPRLLTAVLNRTDELIERREGV